MALYKNSSTLGVHTWQKPGCQRGAEEAGASRTSAGVHGGQQSCRFPGARELIGAL